MRLKPSISPSLWKKALFEWARASVRFMRARLPTYSLVVGVMMPSRSAASATIGLNVEQGVKPLESANF